MDILKELLVSAYPSGKEAVKLIFYFDSGSPYTFIHKSAGERIGNLISLPEPEVFSGLGNGSFRSSQILLILSGSKDIHKRYGVKGLPTNTTHRPGWWGFRRRWLDIFGLDALLREMKKMILSQVR